MLFHNSQDIKYRSPFGATPTCGRVRLRLDVTTDDPPDTVRLRTWYNGCEEIYDMQREGRDKSVYIFTAELCMPSEPCLFWYSFYAEINGKRVWYINNPERLGGIGECADGECERSFQITVYDRKFTTPKWFCGRVMYQIFPDRFYGKHSGEIPKKRDEYIIHYDREEPISFNRHPYENGPACNDFYGGNLKGITDKLPYIKALGVGVIYLNPIFDAYSNHKYDTANYKEIDSMFGTEEDFKELCERAEDLDIKIILDGVFSHTGADSVYFNKYKAYGDGGAFNDSNSPYRSWYQFRNGGYESWWGCSNLPNVNELEPSYLDYILRDKDSVIKKWLRLGASGWRLDVADELPDEFIKILRKEAKTEKSDAVIIGEVWEDATSKVAYGKQREYLLGDELDSVMNYIFRDNLLAFLTFGEGAEIFDMRLMSVLENYPREVSYSLMNLIGTHDTIRAKSLLGGMGDDCRDKRLDSGHEELATYRMKCASFIQMTYPGVPSIYYGDEVGMQGGRDPYNRMPYPWRRIDPELLEHYREVGGLRDRFSVLATGFYKTLYAKDDVLAYARYFKGGKDVFGKRCGEGLCICAINRGFEERELMLDLSEFEYKKFYSGTKNPISVSAEDYKLKITIPPVGYKFIYS